jgi:hypothetical protein
MSEQIFDSIDLAAKAIVRDMRSREGRLGVAVRKASRLTRNYVIAERVPVAFGALRNSIEAIDEGPGVSSVVARGAYAAAVEKGSRPHMPPVDAIEAWVKLRGMQGLTRGGAVTKAATFGPYNKSGTPRDWRRAPARAIAGSLAKMVRGGALSVDAPRQLAWAIAKKISIAGTKAQPYMQSSVPFATQALDRFVVEALPDQGG